MGFSTLVQICNLRYFFALSHIAKVAKAEEIDSGRQRSFDFSLAKLSLGLDGRPAGMTYGIQFEQWVPIAIEKVFLFFTNPNNLPRIMPPDSGTELVALRLAHPPDSTPPVPNLDSLAGVGSEIVTSFRPISFLPFRAQWIALITEFEWNHHFADIQKQGPFKRFQHRHEFCSEARDGASGTTIRDVIEYDPGFGPLGQLAQKLFIAHSLKQTFEYRQRMLEKLLL